MFGVRKAYRELVKSVRVMQQENDRLKAENARLRSELESVGVAAYLYGRGDLLAENAKLRELAADAWGYINHPANATWTHMRRKEVRDSICDRMRDLGVEVDG